MSFSLFGKLIKSYLSDSNPPKQTKKYSSQQGTEYEQLLAEAKDLKHHLEQTKSKRYGPTTTGPVPRPQVQTQTQTTPHAPPPTPTDWSLVLIKELEWKRFETLCTDLFLARGLSAKETGLGADGGIDVVLYKNSDQQAYMYVQCKAWKLDVGVQEVRSFYGVACADNVHSAVFITTSDFTKDAYDFVAKVNQNSEKAVKLMLVSGEKLLSLIQKLPANERAQLKQKTFKGDYSTPTCPHCGIKMVKRNRGSDGQAFWGCANFPACKQIIKMRRS